MRVRSFSVWLITSAALVATGASCASGSDAASAKHKKPTTTTTTTTTTLPRQADPGVQAALDAATHIMESIAPESKPCATPNYETNITLPPEYGIPIPVTRGRCVFQGDQLIAAAFADPANAARYAEAYTKRACSLANKPGQILLGSTFWVMGERTATLLPRPSTADTVARLAGGTVRRVDCPPVQ